MTNPANPSPAKRRIAIIIAENVRDETEKNFTVFPEFDRT
jgi:hypothetical protein